MLRTVRTALIVASLTVPAMWADPMIEVGHVGIGGTIQSGGIGTAIRGSAIRISSLLGFGTPANDGLYGITGNSGGKGSLEFVTGVLRSVTNLGYGVWEYLYDGGGTFTIRGAVATAGVRGNDVLLSGTFYDGRILLQDTGAGYVALMQTAGTASKHPALLNFFGLPNTEFSFTGFSIAANLLGNLGTAGAFSASVLSTSITSTVVPEPGTLLLIGTSMILLSARLRSRRKSGVSPP